MLIWYLNILSQVLLILTVVSLKKKLPFIFQTVMVIDAKSGKATRVSKQKNAEGKSVRITKNLGRKLSNGLRTKIKIKI